MDVDDERMGPGGARRSNGEQGAADVGTITLKGVTYAKGLDLGYAHDPRPVKT